MIDQAVQLVGAALVLAAFAALQRGWLRIDDVRYLALNAIGSGALFIIAILGRDWGFILLEGAWAGISVFGMARVMQRTGQP